MTDNQDNLYFVALNKEKQLVYAGTTTSSNLDDGHFNLRLTSSVKDVSKEKQIDTVVDHINKNNLNSYELCNNKNSMNLTPESLTNDIDTDIQTFLENKQLTLSDLNNFENKNNAFYIQKKFGQHNLSSLQGHLSKNTTLILINTGIENQRSEVLPADTIKSSADLLKELKLDPKRLITVQEYEQHKADIDNYAENNGKIVETVTEYVQYQSNTIGYKLKDKPKQLTFDALKDRLNNGGLITENEYKVFKTDIDTYAKTNNKKVKSVNTDNQMDPITSYKLEDEPTLNDLKEKKIIESHDMETYLKEQRYNDLKDSFHEHKSSNGYTNFINNKFKGKYKNEDVTNYFNSKSSIFDGTEGGKAKKSKKCRRNRKSRSSHRSRRKHKR